MKRSLTETGLNLAEKPISAPSLSGQDKSPTALFGENVSSKTTNRGWLSSAAILSFCVFILLNAIPLGFRLYLSTDRQANNSDDKLGKLHQTVLESPYETNRSGPWPWWIARAYFRTTKPDVVVMGDSQINAAFIQADSITLNKPVDCTVDRACVTLKKKLQQDNPKRIRDDLHFVNLALGGAMPSDYYLMSKTFFTKQNHPKLVVISLSPRSFLDATLSSASATETFQYLAPFVALGNLADYAFTNPIEKYFWLIRTRLTLFTYQQDITLAMHNLLFLCPDLSDHNKFVKGDDPLLSRQPIGSIYSGNGFVSLGDNVVLPNPNVPFRGNEAEYKRRFAQLRPKTLAAQSAYFQSTLQYLKSLGVQVIVVQMPILPPVRLLLPKTFWAGYRSSLKETCRENNAYLLDLIDSSEYPQNQFLDYVHVNAYGAKHFIDQLADYISHNCDLH